MIAHRLNIYSVYHERGKYRVTHASVPAASVVQGAPSSSAGTMRGNAAHFLAIVMTLMNTRTRAPRGVEVAAEQQQQACRKEGSFFERKDPE